MVWLGVMASSVSRASEAGWAGGCNGGQDLRWTAGEAGAIHPARGAWVRSAGHGFGRGVRVAGRVRGTFGNRAIAAVAVLLAGCVETGGGLRSVALLDGALVAAAPAGYCLAPRTGQRSGDSAVVIMGRCSADGATVPAVLTLSIGQAGSAGVLAGGGTALAAYFTSAEGRAALSRSGRASEVEVLSARDVQGAFVMQLRDRQAGESWRGVDGLRGRLVTVSVAGPDGEALEDGQGRALVLAAFAALRRANP